MSHGQENDFPPNLMVYRKYPGLYFKSFLQNSQMLPQVYALSFSYLEFWDTLVHFHVYSPNRALKALSNI